MTNKLEEVLKELQESHVLVEKVKVPKFIADWIETWQGDGRTILHAMSAAEYEVTKYNNPVGTWLTGGRITEHDIKNQIIFVSAWLNGYEIEEEKAKFEVGEYYFSYYGILKVTNLGARVAIGDIYNTRTGNWTKETSVRDDSARFEKARKATDEEIKLFKRAEMYHKHGRKLDELKMDDLMRDRRYTTEGEVFHIESTCELEECIEDLRLGEGIEIYLTVEEQEKAHKKIVGE